MSAAIRIDHYDWAGGREALLRFGPDAPPRVIAAPALFEEANRTRAFLVAVLRTLGEHGIASVLPDLPGQGESIVETAEATLAGWRAAFAAAAGAAGNGLLGIAVRGGALVDTSADLVTRWHLAPLIGADLLTDLRRIARASGEDDSSSLIAGNILSPILRAELTDAVPCPARVARLATDPRPADLKVDGPPLWRRSEPGSDPALVKVVAADIASLVATCGG